MIKLLGTMMMAGLALFLVGAKAPDTYHIDRIKREGLGLLHLQVETELMDNVRWLKTQLPGYFRNLPQDAMWTIKVEDLQNLGRYATASKNGRAIRINAQFLSELTDGDIRSIILHEIVHAQLMEQGLNTNSKCEYLYHEAVATAVEYQYRDLLQPGEELDQSNILNYEGYNAMYRTLYCQTWYAPMPELK